LFVELYAHICFSFGVTSTDSTSHWNRDFQKGQLESAVMKQYEPMRLTVLNLLVTVPKLNILALLLYLLYAAQCRAKQLLFFLLQLQSSVLPLLAA
jgi:hypothetical protein